MTGLKDAIEDVVPETQHSRAAVTHSGCRITEATVRPPTSYALQWHSDATVKRHKCLPATVHAHP